MGTWGSRAQVAEFLGRWKKKTDVGPCAQNENSRLEEVALLSFADGAANQSSPHQKMYILLAAALSLLVFVVTIITLPGGVCTQVIVSLLFKKQGQNKIKIRVPSQKKVHP